MSGILLQAAAAQKPVLSSDYGLMGELVKRYRLGIVVDSTNPLSISKGFIRFLQEDISKICDVEGMQKISKKNSAEKFPKRIFEVLEGSNS
jgi:glycosyltransferase involved in cell wall biosynthesis